WIPASALASTTQEGILARGVGPGSHRATLIEPPQACEPAAGAAGEWVCVVAAQEVPRGYIPDGAVAKERVTFLPRHCQGAYTVPSEAASASSPSRDCLRLVHLLSASCCACGGRAGGLRLGSPCTHLPHGS